MRPLFFPVLVLALALAVPLCGPSRADDGLLRLYGEDEYPIFTGVAGPVAVAVTLPEDAEGVGDVLTFHFRGPDGKVLRHEGEIHGDDRFVVASALTLPGGDYSYLRINRGRESYVVYAGFGLLDEDAEEEEVIAGLAVERDGVLTAHYDMADSFTAELDRELFETLEMALDAYPFHPPLAGEGDMRLLAQALDERIESLREKGGRPVLRAEGRGSLQDKACRFFSLGEMEGEQYTILDEYAVDRSGEIYILADAKREGFAPLRTRAAAVEKKPAAAWEGEYRSGDGTLRIGPLRKGGSGRDFFTFTFIREGETVGQGQAAVQDGYAGSFDLDFRLDNGGDRVRVSLGTPLEGGPEEGWSAQCPGVYRRQ